MASSSGAPASNAGVSDILTVAEVLPAIVGSISIESKTGKAVFRGLLGLGVLYLGYKIITTPDILHGLADVCRAFRTRKRSRRKTLPSEDADSANAKITEVILLQYIAYKVFLKI